MQAETGHSAGVDLRRRVAEVAQRGQGLAVRADLQRAGCSDGALARGVAAGVLLRLGPRVYGLEPLPSRPRFVVTEAGVAAAYVIHVRAALLSLGPGATACRRTAAALHGWGMLVEPARSVEVAVSHGRSRVRRADVRAVQRRSVDRVQVVAVEGTDPLWLTAAVQTVVDCALDLPLVEAVVVCDSALRAGDVTVEELRRAAGRLAGVRDARQVRRVLDLCDPESGSVLESVLRVRMALAGIEGFATQRVLLDAAGRHLRVDFCFAAAGLVVETDGARWHQDPARDRARDNELARLGWRVLRFTWAEVVYDTERVLRELREAVACGCPSVHLRGSDGQQAA